MIPIKDTTKTRSFPFINYFLILLCGGTFVYQLSLGPRLDTFVTRYGLTPAVVSSAVSGRVPDVAVLVPFMTSMFLHGGWVHLLGNMLYLYIFGDNVEDRLGHKAYALFYVLCGVGAAITQVLSDPTSRIPMVGASGAIAGVLGAYFLLYPRARVVTLVPLFVFFPVVEVSAFVFLGIWFALQFLQGMLAGAADQGGVAWWAHAGGFLVGGFLLPLFLVVKRRR
jgi:hypothetical protein